VSANDGIELKPCPFCWSENVEMQCDESDDDWFVFCYGCKCGGTICHTEQEAAAAWNRRAAQ
jgi:hypothetical protein